MKIDNTVAFVTGANRGIGAALVRALLESGASKVYAAVRLPDPMSRQLYANWVTDHKAVERQFAAM